MVFLFDLRCDSMTRVPSGQRLPLTVDFDPTVACQLNGGCVKILSQNRSGFARSPRHLDSF